MQTRQRTDANYRHKVTSEQESEKTLAKNKRMPELMKIHVDTRRLFHINYLTYINEVVKSRYGV